MHQTNIFLLGGYKGDDPFETLTVPEDITLLIQRCILIEDDWQHAVDDDNRLLLPQHPSLVIKHFRVILGATGTTLSPEQPLSRPIPDIVIPPTH
jgi:hypothetical protein